MNSLAIAAAALAGWSPASADVLYAIDQNSDQLFTIDPDMGTATAIGPLGLHWGRSGLDFHEGQLWALGSLNTPPAATALYSIDTSTGAATLEIALDRPVGSQIGMEFAASGDVLYYADGSELYAFDLGAEVSTLIGDIGVVSAGLARSSSDDYYFVNSGDLYELDVANATPTLVAPISGAPAGGIALAFRADDGRLYTTGAAASLVAIDPETAEATVIGPLGVGGTFSGLAFGPEGPVSISPRPWGSIKGSFRK
jgi:hypothetical protein